MAFQANVIGHTLLERHLAQQTLGVHMARFAIVAEDTVRGGDRPAAVRLRTSYGSMSQQPGTGDNRHRNRQRNADFAGPRPGAEILSVVARAE